MQGEVLKVSNELGRDGEGGIGRRGGRREEEVISQKHVVSVFMNRKPVLVLGSGAAPAAKTCQRRTQRNGNIVLS